MTEKKNERVRILIFDLDGTVADTSRSLQISVSETIKHLGLPPITLEDARNFVGNGGRKLMQRSLAKYGDTSEEHLEQMLKIYDGVFAANCTAGNVPYEGMPEVLEKLKTDGYQLVVLSNKDQNRVRDCAGATYRSGLFDIIHGERVGIPLKPDPRALTAVFEELGAQPDEVIYFGDSPSDIQAGKGAGCMTCAVTWGFRSRDLLEAEQPDYIVDRPEDILKIL